MNAKFYSMTGYAHVEKTVGAQQFRLHLKSVNHRFTEIRFKAPRGWAIFEITAKKYLQHQLQRGSIDFWVEDLSQESEHATDKLDLFFSKLSTALDKSSGLSRFVLPGPVRALILARFPDYWLGGRKEESTDEKELMTALEGVVECLKDERQKEGEKTVRDLLGYAVELENHFTALKARVPELRSEWEKKLRERMDQLAAEFAVPNISQERLLQEFLILAEKRDVAEELQRIAMHLGALKELFTVARADGLGKRLEFLLQELHREWTTFGNKIQNSNMGGQIVEAKIALERLREQSLNLV